MLPPRDTSARQRTPPPGLRWFRLDTAGEGREPQAGWALRPRGRGKLGREQSA
jgi:hypothetical protein